MGRAEVKSGDINGQDAISRLHDGTDAEGLSYLGHHQLLHPRHAPKEDNRGKAENKLLVKHNTVGRRPKQRC